MKELFEKHQLTSHSDERGSLTVFDKLDELVDWQIKRSYWLSDIVKDRGGHCVKGEKKFYIMARGSCVARMFDGDNWYEIQLNAPSDALEFKADLWREFTNFSDGAVIFTLCNEHYNPDKYIRTIDEYRAYIKNKPV